MKEWHSGWKASKKPSKQRKYIANAPLHIKQKLVAAHLSKELRKKFALRSLSVRKGDKVKIMRGQHRGKEGKVAKVDLKKSKVFIEGFENIRKDGTKALMPFHPSNLMIIELASGDKKRIKKKENK